MTFLFYNKLIKKFYTIPCTPSLFWCIYLKTQNDVVVGDIITIGVDWAMVHDGTIVLTKVQFEKVFDKVFDPEKIIVAFDHLYPPNTENTANLLKDSRDFIKRQGIKRFFEGGQGVCHQLLLECDDIKPGDFLVGADSHSATVGAKYCLSMGVGATDMAYIFGTGTTWIKIPEAIKVKLIEKLSSECTYKDVFLKIAETLKVDGAVYKGLVFETDDLISIEDRAILCNMGTEIGAKFSIFEPCEDELQHLLSDGDDDFSYIWELDLDEVKPKVACPHDVKDFSLSLASQQPYSP
ncbi:3-isopropylmalate dehydratase large subunit [subsurface metagenome]